MERTCPLKTLIFSGLFLLAAAGAVWGSSGQIVLEADRVEFDQASGFAVATGNVRMSRDALRVFAGRLEYHSAEQTIEAFSGPDTPVVLLQGGQRLEGERLSLDIISGEGTLVNAKGSFPAEKGDIHASGSDVTTMRVQTARAEGSLPARISEGAIEGDRIYRWGDVGFTTCAAAVPHYQLVSDRLLIVPGHSVTASRPRIYVGGKYLLSYPFDYVIDLSGGRHSQFLPLVMYEGDKGVGISYGAPFNMGGISSRWKVFLWSEVGLEAAVSMEYPLSENISLFADLSYDWDPDKEEKRFRPKAGADYDLGGWTGRLWWSGAESVSMERALGDTFKGTLWRRPEFTVNSPSLDLPGSFGSFSLRGIWGDYESEELNGTDTVRVQRSGIGATWKGSAENGGARYFWGLGYWWFKYDPGSGTQGILDSRLGVSWPLGPLSMTSAWIRRWVDGASPMAWDNNSESNAFYQKIVIPFGDKWSITVRGGYNLIESRLDEMYYRISYGSKCCYRIDLSYRDDRAGNDDWAGITFVLNAFPSHPFYLGAKEIEEFE